MDNSPSPEALRLKGRWLHGVRLGFVLILLTSVTFQAFHHLPEETVTASLMSFYSLIIFISLFTLISLLAHQKVRRVRKFLMLTTALDTLCLLVFIYMTGGPNSVATPLLAVLLVFSAYLLGRGHSRLITLLAATGLSIISSLYLRASEAKEILPGVLDAWSRPASLSLLPVLFNTLVLCASFIALSELSGILAEHLNRARVFTKDILDNLFQGVLLCDTDGLIMECNPALLRMLDVSQLVPGSVIEDILPDVLIELIYRERHDLQDIDLIRGDTVVPVECRVSPVTDQNGQKLGMLLTLVDLSDRRNIEKMKERQRRSETLAGMASGIAHEIRNPLAAIRSASQSLSDIKLKGKEREKLLSLIIREGDRLDGIVSSFMDYSNLKPLDQSICRLSDIVADVVQILEIDPQRNQCSIKVAIPESLFIHVDINQMKQVFLNLGLNAFQAMGPNGILEIAASTDGANVTVTIKDSGPGIPEAMHRKIFDPFVTTKDSGTGLGLAVVDRILREHGGAVRIGPQNRGCTLELDIPLPNRLN